MHQSTVLLAFFLSPLTAIASQIALIFDTSNNCWTNNQTNGPPIATVYRAPNCIDMPPPQNTSCITYRSPQPADRSYYSKHIKCQIFGYIGANCTGAGAPAAQASSGTGNQTQVGEERSFSFGSDSIAEQRAGNGTKSDLKSIEIYCY